MFLSMNALIILGIVLLLVFHEAIFEIIKFIFALSVLLVGFAVILGGYFLIAGFLLKACN